MPNPRACLICGTTFTPAFHQGRPAVTCSPECFLARRRERGRESAGRYYREVSESRPWIAKTPMFCVDCGIPLERIKGDHTSKRCPEHRESHNSARLVAKEYRRRVRRHGLTVNGYEELLATQGHGCAICGITEPGGRGTWHIDHDHACCESVHSCGKCVRGLLCQSCNFLIGHAHEDPAVLAAAVRYLT